MKTNNHTFWGIKTIGTVFCIYLIILFKYIYAYYWDICLVTEAQYSQQCIIMQNTVATGLKPHKHKHIDGIQGQLGVNVFRQFRGKPTT